MLLGHTTFDWTQQEAFAVLSGDCNPIHLDEIAARRTQVGRPVLHGVHGLLWALEALCASEKLAIKRVKVTFSAPIYVGDDAGIFIVEQTSAKVRLQIRVRDSLCTSIVVGLGTGEQKPTLERPAAVQPAAWPTIPRPVELEKMCDVAGAVEFAQDAGAYAAVYPALTRVIEPERVAALAALSRIVGMIAPGLYSIFHGFEVDFTTPATDWVSYRVRTFDDRFRLLRLAVEGGGLSGELTAQARIPPIEQPSMHDIAPMVSRDRWPTARVLVIGGSRGLGEVVAKICAAGGAEVTITCRSGKDDALRVAAEIQAAGGLCNVVTFDVLREVSGQLDSLPALPTHLYYFASGHIAATRPELMKSDLLAEFIRYYVTGFFETCSALSEKSADRLHVFYPSTVYIDDAPPGLTTYAMAKAAGETLCRQMNEYLPAVDIQMERLPVLLTDQTSAQAEKAEMPVEAMLRIVTALQASGPQG